MTRVVPPARHRRPPLPPQPGPLLAVPGGKRRRDGRSCGALGERGESNSWSRAGSGGPAGTGRGWRRRGKAGDAAAGAPRAAPPALTEGRRDAGAGSRAEPEPPLPPLGPSSDGAARAGAGSAPGARAGGRAAGARAGRGGAGGGVGGAAAQHRGHRPCGRACADPDVPGGGGGQRQVSAQARAAASALRMHLLRLPVSRAGAGEPKRGGRASEAVSGASP